MRAVSLLQTVSRLLRLTYRIEPVVDDLAPFIIGDAGYRELYGADEPVATAGAAGSPGAKTLVRELGGSTRVCVYFPDDLIRRLEAHPPQAGLFQGNVESFATFVEEIDHLLLIAERSAQDRPISLFELELHANLSKHLVLTRFLAGQARRLSPDKQLWLRSRLFGDVYCDDDPSVRSRYRDAARWCVRLIDGLVQLPTAARIDSLRAFHACGSTEKLELISRLAA